MVVTVELKQSRAAHACFVYAGKFHLTPKTLQPCSTVPLCTVQFRGGILVIYKIYSVIQVAVCTVEVYSDLSSNS